MKNVAITGRGVVSSLGSSVDEFLAGLVAGQACATAVGWSGESGIGHVYRSAVTAFEPADWMDERVLRGTDPFAQYAIAAAAQAVNDAGIGDNLDPLRTAVVIGTSMAGAKTLCEAQQAYDKSGYDAVPKKLQLMAWPNMAAGHIALRYGLHGPLLTVSTACASSLDAIGVAAQMIETGQVDVAIAGGSDYGDVPVSNMGAVRYGMSPAGVEDPRLICRPFDRNRLGVIGGEGAGVVVLEAKTQAHRRGATVHGLLRGYASLADAYHPSSPNPTGEWERAAMQGALRGAGLDARDVQAIIAHATGTPVGDAAEIAAINETFTAAGASVVATGIKGHVGHTAGAAGVMGLFAGLYAMAAQRVVPTANTRDLDDAVDFTVPLGAPLATPVDAVMVNAFGFGGQNASVIVSAD